MAYELKYERRARRSIAEAVKAATPADRRHVAEAVRLLEANPYPSNRDAKARDFTKLRGAPNRWRYRVSKRFRVVYSIRGNQAITERLEHRKTAYRRL